MTAFSDRVPDLRAGRNSATLSYAVPPGGRALPKLGISCARTTPDHNMSLAEYRAVIETITGWKTPEYISVGSPEYDLRDRVFDHRMWSGWMGWFPRQVDPEALPPFALVDGVSGGTLVATQASNVVSRNPDEKERAQAVEIALTRLGLLPTQPYLLGQE